MDIHGIQKVEMPVLLVPYPVSEGRWILILYTNISMFNNNPLNL